MIAKRVNILLDGMPYSIIEDLYLDGKITGLCPPKRLISTFPSLTEPAYNYIFLDGIAHSYGPIQYDRKRKWLRVKSKEEAVVFGFDFMQSDTRFMLEAIKSVSKKITNNFGSKLFSFLRYFISRYSKGWKTFVEVELHNSEKIIMNSTKRNLIIVLNSFDEYCHREGLEKTKEKLVLFFEWLQSLQQKELIDVIVFSDHGNAPTQFNYINYNKLLKDAGYDVTTNLYTRAKVLIPLYVSVSFFSVYCASELSTDVAEFLSNQAGVDLVMVKRPDGTIRIIKNGIISEVKKIEGTYHYKIVTGDSLDLINIINDNNLPLTTEGYTAIDWFILTHDHIYPNPIERIYKAFYDVTTPADLLVSLDDDSVYGYPFSHKLYNAVCMHGNLRKKSSTAFIMASKNFNSKSAAFNIYNFDKSLFENE